MSTSFWTAIAFIALLAFMIRPAIRILRNKLDDKIHQVSKALDEAASIKKDAEAMLLKLQAEHIDTKQRCITIVTQAKVRTTRLLEDTQQQMDKLKEQKTAFVKRYMVHREQQMLLEVKKELFNHVLQAVSAALHNAKLETTSLSHNNERSHTNVAIDLGLLQYLKGAADSESPLI